MPDSPDAVRAQVVTTARRLGETGLSLGTSGNVSTRFEDGFLVTPSAFAYESMQPSDLVELDLAGQRRSGSRRPSTEWPFHAAIYRARSDVAAIVHAHPAYSTALSCVHRDIPPFHYMVAVAGGRSIRCAGWAAPGSVELAQNLVTALGRRHACLMANHGMVAVGPSAPEALAMGLEVENLARQYWLTLQIGEPTLLGDAEIEQLLERFESYGLGDD